MNRRRRPRIGVSSYPRSGAREAYSLPSNYVDAIRTAGGVPVILPPGEKSLDDLLDLVDGLVLSGGGDVDPARYAGDPHETVYGVNEERDVFELELANAALGRKDLPILCICRGMQVVNVVLGGSLHPHLPDLGGTVEHRHPERTPTRHPARVDAASQLGKILGATEVDVSSWHHQAIDRIGRGLTPVAWAADGIIEAVEHDVHPFCVGVQWHPEMQLEDPLQRKIFEALVDRSMDSRIR